MKLTDLHPEFWQLDDKGVATVMPTAQGAHGVIFDCPCGDGVRVFICFENPLGVERRASYSEFPHRAAPLWHRDGETVGTLTLRPSLLIGAPECWHGWLTNGEMAHV